MRDEYERRLESRRSAAEAHGAQFRSVGTWRLVTAVAGAVLVWRDFWLLPIPVAAFAILLVWHERISRRALNETRAGAWYERALARLNGDWAGAGESGERFRSPAHPYADDLDVFGRGSVFQLINTARTEAGEAQLAAWLSAPSPAGELRGRQAAVLDLRDRLDLREDLALLGEDVRAGLHPEALRRWGAAPSPSGFRSWHRPAALSASAALLITFSGYMLHFWTLAPVLVAVLLELALFTVMKRPMQEILAAVESPALDLRILAGLLERFEREPFDAPLLAQLKARITTKDVPASKQISQLRRLIDWRDQARNQMFAVVVEPLLWSPHFAFAIEAWRRNCGAHIGEWLQAVAEIEALGSLAGYASEHPDDPFPELLDQGPVFDGTAIAHPLLPAALAIRNDVRLDRDLRLLLVSGSNMSGKSTLLRSVGLNSVLAWAGAPVRASALRVSPLAVGASMRVQDSILDGKSRFYAETTRLRQIVDMSGANVPLLFLLDEILSGTNSHDRLIGAEAVVRTLVERGAIGLVTTHDLALAHIAEQLAPRAANVHFEDHIEDGHIAFDYRMLPGVVTKSNALELMRSVGLEV